MSNKSRARVTEERVAIPVRPAREFAAEAKSELTAAIELIEQWGVPVPADSRVRVAVDILGETIATGRFSPNQRGDDLGYRALQLALDVCDIARTLPTEDKDEFRVDLTRALMGNLDPGDDDDPAPQQFQSQLMLRAALVKAGTNPRIPTEPGDNGQKPDLLVDKGNSTYALEAKRPTKRKNIVRRTTLAADQIRDVGLQGGIVIDATDCLLGAGPSQWDAELLEIARQVAEVAFIDGVGYRPGFSHVLMVLAFARPMWISSEQGADAQALVHNSSVSWAFGNVRGTLGHLRGDWLRCEVERGLNQLGFTQQENPRLSRSEA